MLHAVPPTPLSPPRLLAAIAGAAFALAAAGDDAHADRRFGVMVDAGVPDGATGSLVLGLTRSLGLHVGGGHNLVSPGVRVGATFTPFDSWITPVVAVDYGRYFEGNANGLAQKVMGDPEYSSPLLERVGYDYANAHVGLELGGPRGKLYLRGGMSRVTGELHGVNEAAGEGATLAEDPAIEVWSVSAKIGFIYYVAP
jgi:hypothetical protein